MICQCLEDPPTGAISTTWKKRVLRSVGALCYHSPSQNHNEIQRLSFESTKIVTGIHGHDTKALRALATSFLHKKL